MSQTDELLPCPFCGNTQLGVFEMYTEDLDYTAVECSQCKAEAPISVWNRRAAPGDTAHWEMGE